MSSNQTQQGYAPFDLYPYNPTTPPAYAFLALFGILCLLHLCVLIPYRSLFPIPHIIGCGMEAAAYYFRSLSHDDVRKTLPFLIQNLLILSAPPFLAASIYMSLRRIARQLNREDLVYCPRLLTKLFILVDVVCFGTQVAGSIMAGDADQSKASQGKTTIVSGLVLQILALGLFVAWSAVFHGRLRSLQIDTLGQPKFNWERHIYGLYAIRCLFVVRNVTRLIEYSQGASSPMLSSEVYLYVLDGSVMVALVVIFLVFHPGQLKRRTRRAQFTPFSGSEAALVDLGSTKSHP